MIKRFFIIVYLLMKAMIAYLLLLFTRKRLQSCLVHADFGKSGGTRTYFFSLIEYLSLKKLNITVLLTKEQCDEEVVALQSNFLFVIQEINFELQPTIFKGTVFYKRNQKNFIYHLKELFFFWKMLRLSKCSLFIITQSTPEVLLFLFLSPVKLMYILHTVATEKLDRLKQKILNASLCNHKKIITVSEYSKNKLLQNWTDGGNEEHVKVVHNFYDPPTQNTLQRNQMEKMVFTIGSLGHHKNPLFWIDVAKIVTNRYAGQISFIWAGEGELLEQCKEECSGFDNIKFIGVTKNVEQLYVDCDVYFQPSILESHGIAVVGAMYFEKACIVSDRQGLPESVVNNVTGLIVPIEDPLDSANAILSLLNDAEKVNDFGRAAKKKVEQQFTKTRWNKTMDLIFNDMCRKQEKHANVAA